MRGWKNNACLQENAIYLFKFSSILKLSKTIFWVTLPFGNILPVTHRYLFTCLPKNTTGMSVSQFMCIWEATKQRQWKTSLGFCHIPAATCLQEPRAGSPHPSPPSRRHPFLTPMPVLLLFALLFTNSACISLFLLPLFTYCFLYYISYFLFSHPLFCFLLPKA